MTSPQTAKGMPLLTHSIIDRSDQATFTAAQRLDALRAIEASESDTVFRRSVLESHERRIKKIAEGLGYEMCRAKTNGPEQRRDTSFWIIDARTNTIVVGGEFEVLSLSEVEDWLTVLR